LLIELRQMAFRTFPLILLSAWALGAADQYTGPRPDKPDLPYLLHADHLVPTETGEAREENRKGETVFMVPGANSSARTPLAEPILIMESRNVPADRMEMYKMEVKGGNREVTISQSRRRGGSRPIHVVVTPLVASSTALKQTSRWRTESIHFRRAIPIRFSVSRSIDGLKRNSPIVLKSVPDCW